MKFCSNCGHDELEFRIPDLDNLPRFCCPKCGTIFYSNPKIIAGTVSYIDNQVLLCKRAIQPRYGLWTLPAGFMENGETLENGAFRETLEETGTEVEIKSLYRIFNIPQISQVYMLFLANLKNLDFKATSESLEVKLFPEKNIPWEDLAFPFVPLTLKSFFQDLEEDNFPLKIEVIERPRVKKD